MPGRTVLPLAESLDHQRAACARAGSPLYADLIAGIADDVARGGVCAAVLGPHAGESFASALPLRFLGAVHRLVLEGRAPALAAHYPSTGGSPGAALVADFLAVVDEWRPVIDERVADPVQTNEVGRSAVLAPGYALVARRSGLPLRVFEVGASGGLNLRWDHFWYDSVGVGSSDGDDSVGVGSSDGDGSGGDGSGGDGSGGGGGAPGRTTLGDPASPVRFEGVWRPGPDGLPDLGGPVVVAERAGCDRHPVDVTTDAGRLTLRAYLWPDHLERRARLEAAFAVATRVPAPVEAGDLGACVERRLAEPAPGSATVVVHSIVWQYVSREARDRMRSALREAGARATPDAPIAWLRFEPAGEVGDLRLTWWPGGEETVLATAEYHGVPVYWGATTAAG